MDHNSPQNNRLYMLAGFLAMVLAIYVGVLYNTQVIKYDEYQEKSIRSIARVEKVEASRGIITDRSGRTLVTNRSAYALTFDSSLLKDGDDENKAILRLVKLCQEQGVEWNDNLPITRQAPFSYTLDQLSDVQKNRFLTYLKSLKDVKTALGDYLLQQSASQDEEGPSDDAGTETGEFSDAALRKEADALVDTLTAENLTA